MFLKIVHLSVSKWSLILKLYFVIIPKSIIFVSLMIKGFVWGHPHPTFFGSSRYLVSCGEIRGERERERERERGGGVSEYNICDTILTEILNSKILLWFVNDNKRKVVCRSIPFQNDNVNISSSSVVFPILKKCKPILRWYRTPPFHEGRVLPF